MLPIKKALNYKEKREKLNYKKVFQKQQKKITDFLHYVIAFSPDLIIHTLNPLRSCKYPQTMREDQFRILDTKPTYVKKKSSVMKFIPNDFW